MLEPYEDIPVITITTVLKTSDRYTSRWIDIMLASLKRNMSIDFEFKPMSDSSHPYPSYNFVQNNPGFWNKVELFRPGLWSGPVLFLDLDTVITGDLAPIIQHCRGQKFLMYRGNPNKDTNITYPASPVMYWEQAPTELWDIWNSQPAAVWYKRYAGGSLGDQAFIRDHACFKIIQDCMPAGTNYFCSNKKTFNEDARLIVLGGPSKKPDVMDWHIIKQHWRLD